MERKNEEVKTKDYSIPGCWWLTPTILTRDQEDRSLRSAQANCSRDPTLKNPITKRAGGIAKSVGEKKTTPKVFDENVWVWPCSTCQSPAITEALSLSPLGLSGTLVKSNITTRSYCIWVKTDCSCQTLSFKLATLRTTFCLVNRSCWNLSCLVRDAALWFEVLLGCGVAAGFPPIPVN
jgi:hypothetical protein